MKQLLRILKPLLVLLIFALAVYLLYNKLHGLDYGKLVGELRHIPLSRIFIAIGLTGLNYVFLFGYDFLAVKYIGHPLPLRRLALASFIGHVSSFNFGAILGGSSIRYRFYSAWGYSTVEILQLIAILGITFWLGVLGLAGFVFILAPLPMPADSALPAEAHALVAGAEAADPGALSRTVEATARLVWDHRQMLGAVLIVHVGVYLLICAIRRRPLRIFGWELPLPPPTLTMAQIGVACADLLIAAAVLYALVPLGMEISYPEVLGVYLLGMVVAVFTHVPAGLGVFELVVLVFLPGLSQERVMAWVLVFRAVYYLLPLVIASVLLAVHEAIAGRKYLKQAAQWLDAIDPAVVPRILAFVIFLGGAFLLFSGATPAVDRSIWQRFPWSWEVVEGAHLAAGLVGVTLLFLAYGILRRIRSAYWLSVAMLIAGVAMSLMCGMDYRAALILGVMLMAILPTRRHFYRRGSALRQPMSTGWLTAVLAVLVCAVWLGLFAFKKVGYTNALWYRFGLEQEAARALRTMAAAILFAGGLGAVALIRPPVPRLRRADGGQVEIAARIAAQAPTTSANLALLGDKMFLFNRPQTAMLMYAVHGRSWIAMGDPIGPAAELPDLAWDFRDLCDAHGGWPVFFEVDNDHEPLYVDLGLDLLHLGDEARVRLATLSADDADRQQPQVVRRRLIDAGCSFEVLPADSAGDILPTLQAVSDAWLAAKELTEKWFFVSRFEESYVRRFPVGIVRREGKIIAFATLWTAAAKEELAADLIRYLPDAPDGIVDYLLLELMAWGKQQHYAWFNLGIAPLAGLDERHLMPVWNRLEGIIIRQGEQFSSFRATREYKQRFAPQWRPRYLASPGGLALSRILTDLASLITEPPRA